jgi:hypothetical protein
VFYKVLPSLYTVPVFSCLSCLHPLSVSFASLACLPCPAFLSLLLCCLSCLPRMDGAATLPALLKPPKSMPSVPIRGGESADPGIINAGVRGGEGGGNAFSFNSTVHVAVVCGLWSVVCCLRSVVCCLFSVVYCLLSLVCGLWSVVCCLFPVVCDLSRRMLQQRPRTCLPFTADLAYFIRHLCIPVCFSYCAKALSLCLYPPDVVNASNCDVFETTGVMSCLFAWVRVLCGCCCTGEVLNTDAHTRANIQ